MQSTNGSGPRRAILYARVSTEEQARSGYSLAQQIEALREYAAREGYEILEEVVDPGHSGASLERPGMDRVRDLVAAGSVSMVLAQDRDRFTREPAYHYLLQREFEEYGCKLRALNDRGDNSPEGELTNSILDQLAKFQRAQITRSSRRGKLQKAREGKLIAGHTPNYGFAFNTTRDSYVVNEETMPNIRRIFGMIGEGQSIYSVVNRLEQCGVPAPAGRRWNKTMIRNLILNDLYRPHNYEEMAELVTQDVLARLDPEARYGVWWFNRRRVVATHVSEDGPEGRRYRKRNKTTAKGQEEWIAVPVLDAGISREVVDAARASIKDNRAPSNAGRRFWQLSGRIIHCEVCSSVMEPHTVGRKNGRKNYYYQCRQRYNNGPRDCTNRRSIRAENLEGLVWEFVSGLLKDPERLRKGLEAMIEEAQEGTRDDPEQEAKAWLERLSEADRKRGRFQDMAAEGLITLDELRSKLADIEESRKAARRELNSLSQRREKIENLERDKDAVMESYAGMLPAKLEALSSERRHQIYKMLRLRVIAGVGGGIKVNGSLGDGLRVCGEETMSLSS